MPDYVPVLKRGASSISAIVLEIERIGLYLRDVATIVRGRAITGIVLANGGAVTRVRHQLGRQLTGWIVIRRTTTAAAAGIEVEVTTDGTDTVDPARELWLKSVGFGAAETIAVWVF